MQKKSQLEMRSKIDEIETLSKELNSLKGQLRSKEKMEKELEEFYQSNTSIY